LEWIEPVIAKLDRVNLGDVIKEEGRIYGDGVNIAARLESLADPGGICISKTAFDSIESTLLQVSKQMET